MRQVLQNLENGQTLLMEVPAPMLTSRTLIIQSEMSLISAGTERMLLDFSKSTLLDKARQQPEKVKMVLNKIIIDGFLTTLEAVRSKLAQPLPLGYSNVGVVTAAGDKVQGYKPGDRVVSNGPHAEILRVGERLCAHVPENVDNESAAFTVVASIGLQGIRILKPTLGESIAIIGVGLIGLIMIQLLHAHGCRVLAIDFDDRKLELARSFGAETCNPNKGEDPVTAGLMFSRGRGMDGVLIAASTRSSDPVAQAARMCRKRGRIVLVGVTGLKLNRSDFYEKELTFQVSCSYGPGRYDPSYEEEGKDYPIGFVRWTEQRNFEAVLDLMARGQINVKPLITHRYPLDQAVDAYQALTENKSSLGILLHYAAAVNPTRTITLNALPSYQASTPILGVVGAGNYASRMLIPAFKKAGAELHTVVTSGGLSGAIHGKKAGFLKISTDINEMLATSEVNTVAIVTRHDTHAQFVIKALQAGKHVFVEKPLALTIAELEEIKNACAQNQSLRLMVGFNRRFAPQVQKIKALLSVVKEPKVFIMTVNAGSIPKDHWTQNVSIGGGRIIGEACHFIDLMRYLAGAKIISLQACCMGRFSGTIENEDKSVLTLGFADGSLGTIHYLANGSSRFPKERIEVFAQGSILQLDNFRKLVGYDWPGFKKMNLWRQDKGQLECARQFINSITERGETPIPINEIFEVSEFSIKAAELLRNQ